MAEDSEIEERREWSVMGEPMPMRGPVLNDVVVVGSGVTYIYIYLCVFCCSIIYPQPISVAIFSFCFCFFFLERDRDTHKTPDRPEIVATNQIIICKYC